jgi:hypothetical protein
MIVHNRIAQVTTRKMSEGSPETTPGGENMPFDSATPEIKKPISPRAHIASARMSGGCMESGFDAFGELVRSSLDVGIGASASEAAIVVWFGVAVDGCGAVCGFVLPQK